MLHSALAKTNADTSSAEVAGTFNPTEESEVSKRLQDDAPELIALASVVASGGSEEGYTKLLAQQWQGDRYIKRKHNVFVGAADGADIIQFGPAIWPLPVPVTLYADEDWTVYFKTATASKDQGLILYYSYGARFTDLAGAVGITSRRITASATVVDTWTAAAATISDLDPARKYLLIGGQVNPAANDGVLAARVKAPSFEGLTPMIPPSGRMEILPEFMPIEGKETISVDFYGGIVTVTPTVDLFFAEFPKVIGGAANERPSEKAAVTSVGARQIAGGGGGGGGIGGFSLGNLFGGR